MILLQTLTRIHISATLLAAQVIGTATTMLARAVESSTLVTVDVTFPDFGLGWSDGLQRPWFWVGMALQLIVCAGFGLFFRKEQLNKP
jgi:alpha-1,3-glucan synthase